MHLKIPLFSRGLKLSNSEPGCRVSALHFFVKWILPMAFWHQAHSDKYFLKLVIPGITPVSLLESGSGFEIVTQLVDIGKRPSSHLTSMSPKPKFQIASQIKEEGKQKLDLLKILCLDSGQADAFFRSANLEEIVLLRGHALAVKRAARLEQNLAMVDATLNSLIHATFELTRVRYQVESLQNMTFGHLTNARHLKIFWY